MWEKALHSFQIDRIWGVSKKNEKKKHIERMAHSVIQIGNIHCLSCFCG